MTKGARRLLLHAGRCCRCRPAGQPVAAAAAATYQNDFPICHLLGWIEFCVANKLWSHLKLSTPPVIYYYLYTYLLLQFLKTKGHLFWWCHFTSVKNFLTSFWDDYSYTYCPTGVVSWLPLTSIYRYVTYSKFYI